MLFILPMIRIYCCSRKSIQFFRSTHTKKKLHVKNTKKKDNGLWIFSGVKRHWQVNLAVSRWKETKAYNWNIKKKWRREHRQNIFNTQVRKSTRTTLKDFPPKKTPRQQFPVAFPDISTVFLRTTIHHLVARMSRNM